MSTDRTQSEARGQAIGPDEGSPVGDSFDNAVAESVLGLYTLECVRHDGPFRTVDEVGPATLSSVDWWNHDRLHGEIVHSPPVEFEQRHYRHIIPQQGRASTEPGRFTRRGGWREPRNMQRHSARPHRVAVGYR